MDSIKDVLKIKADDWEDSAIPKVVRRLQKELDKLAKLPAKVVKFEDGIVTIVTSSSSVASDIRLQQTALIDKFSKVSRQKISSLRIRIQ